MNPIILTAIERYGATLTLMPSPRTWQVSHTAELILRDKILSADGKTPSDALAALAAKLQAELALA